MVSGWNDIACWVSRICRYPRISRAGRRGSSDLSWCTVKNLGKAVLVVVWMAFGPAVWADEAADLAAIRQESQAFVEAFNRADAASVAALWAEQGEYTDEAGRTLKGRVAIAEEYRDFFAKNPGAKIRLAIDSLKLLSPTAALEDGRAMIDSPTGGAASASKYLAVHVKVDGRWMMSTVRDARDGAPGGSQPLADLEWLIGSWRAEEHGARVESVCRWVAGKSFVERTYTTTLPGGATQSGVQIIGWSPTEGQVQSWSFTSDGGHAVGMWRPQARGWAAEMRGVTGDGRGTAAINRLTKLDNDAYVWQSVQRSVGGQSVADTDEVVLKRVAAKPAAAKP